MFAVEYKDMSFKYCDLHLIILRQFESFKRISKIHPLLCKKKKKMGRVWYGIRKSSEQYPEAVGIVGIYIHRPCLPPAISYVLFYLSIYLPIMLNPFLGLVACECKTRLRKDKVVKFKGK